MLRHPIDRLLSVHAFHCVSCGGAGRQCGEDADPRLACPNMANLEMCTLDGCAPCFTAIRAKDGCNCRILATPPCKHAPFWLPSSQCSHPPADGCDGCVPAIRPAA